MKIAVGLSGGIDSSVAALLLKREGHEIVGLTMKISSDIPTHDSQKNSCLGQNEDEKSYRVREICKILGIQNFEIDLSSEFRDTVISYFKKEYLSGRTPNPCVVCNRELKFGNLARHAIENFNVKFFATGHYARIKFDRNKNVYYLQKAKDILKDQSYFLYGLTQNQLKKTLFPLGNLLKEEVRDIAKINVIPYWSQSESQDFYSGNYSDLIQTSNMNGDIIDIHGNILGRHEGVWNYTIGQRKGLGIAYSEPLYVISIDSLSGKIVVGTKYEALKKSFIIGDLKFHGEKPPSGKKFKVKIRSAHLGSSCSIFFLEEDKLKITLDSPETGIAPGQSAVIYDYDIIVGGGIIESADLESQNDK